MDNGIKVCTKCKLSQNVSEFHKSRRTTDGYNSWCKKCKQAAYRTNNPGAYKICPICGTQYCAKRIDSKCCGNVDCKKQYGRQYSKQYYSNNKVNKKKYGKIYYEENRGAITAYKNKWRKQALRDNIHFKLRNRLRKRIKTAIKNNHKSGSAVKDLGCSVEELKTYLESQFQPGMSWDNYGFYGWHIDHIKPLSSFDLTNPEEFKKACHYTNLQPMWAKDNLSKGDK